MNRFERRATAAKARSFKLDRIAAIHESGHAVARVLVATETGHSATKAISRIDIGSGQSLGRSADGQASLHSMATTYGPWLPPAAEDFVKLLKLRSGDTISPGQLKEAMAAAEQAGVDVEIWAGGRVFHIAAGAAAEAKLSKQNFDTVWNSYACEDDVNAAIRDCKLAGLDESTGTPFIAKHASRAIDAMNRPALWCAVLALADRLPTSGRMAGPTAIAIIQRALQA